MFLFVLYLPGPVQLAYFPSNLYYGNVNTNASESLQTSYDHNKCPDVNENGLRLLRNAANMPFLQILRACF